jgi:hypothetical protein
MKWLKALIAVLALCCGSAFAQGTALYTNTTGSGNGTSWTRMPGGVPQPFDLQVVFHVDWPIGQTALLSPLSASGQWNVTSGGGRGGGSVSTNHTAVPQAPVIWAGQYSYVIQYGYDSTGSCIYADQTPCQYSMDGYNNLLLEGTQTSLVFFNNQGYTGVVANYCGQQFPGANATFLGGEVDDIACTTDAHWGPGAQLVTEVVPATDVNGNPIIFVKTHTAPDVWAAGITDASGNFTMNVALAPGFYIIDTPGITSCSGRNCALQGGSNFNTSWNPQFTAPPLPPPPCGTPTTPPCDD